MGDFCDSERGQIVVARLAGASVIKTVILLGVWRVTVSKVMAPHTNQNHGNFKRNATLTERDRRTLRRIVSKNHSTTAAQVNCSRT
jgi:hypothetical protein